MTHGLVEQNPLLVPVNYLILAQQTFTVKLRIKDGVYVLQVS